MELNLTLCLIGLNDDGGGIVFCVSLDRAVGFPVQLRASGD